ncbi:MAG: type II secretion system F family protein, partial [Anaerovoracaceae bacterium]
MPIFEYNAAQLSGKKVKGKKQADSAATLRTALEEENLYLISCKEAEEKKTKPMKAKLLAEFCRELGM